MVDEQTGFTTKSILCAPLSLGEDCLGCIEIINKNTGDGLFEVDDLTLLETLAGAAALAGGVVEVSTRAGIHGGGEHELRGKGQRGRRPRNRDHPIFLWLTSSPPNAPARLSAIPLTAY